VVLSSESCYFEDFAIESVSTSRTRTITETDIVNFAGISGDFVELHMSETYAAKGPFGRRIWTTPSLLGPAGVIANSAFYGLRQLCK
jgi:acyl dehydratase